MRSDDPGEPTTEKPRVSIARDEELILSGLAAGKDVLEIGTGLGVSTLAIASTASSVVTVDVDPWVAMNIAPLLRDRRVLFCSDIPDDGEYDMAFVDGDHNSDSVCRDAARCSSRLRSGGLLVFHDALSGNVFRGVSESGMEMFVIPTTYGLGLWVKW